MFIQCYICGSHQKNAENDKFEFLGLTLTSFKNIGKVRTFFLTNKKKLKQK